MTGGATPSTPVAGSDGRLNLLGLSLDELEVALRPWVDRPYRVTQIYDALYRRGVCAFGEMTDLSKLLRRRLESVCSLDVPRVEQVRKSRDGTRKYLLRLEDGAAIETVLIPEAPRLTLCLSSQAGCALGCRFCVTGYWGAGRDLSAGEMVAQLLMVRQEEPRLPRGLNLVFMGMGEPLLNLGPLHAALRLLTELVSWRRTTVSTAGIVPGILAMASWPRRPNLAVSLHAPDDDRRSRMMPINRRYPLEELLAALRSYPLEGKRRLTFEYTLIRDFNDARADARDLARRIRGLRAKVNLLPLNPDPVLGPEMRPPSRARVSAFEHTLLECGVPTSVRRARGDDILAACGQLRGADGPALSPAAR